MSWPRFFLAVLLSAAVVPSSGCAFFTVSLREAGLRHEKPWHGGKGPVVEAYTNEDPSRLVVRYKMAVSNDQGNPVPFDRWLSIDRSVVEGLMPRYLRGHLRRGELPGDNVVGSVGFNKYMEWDICGDTNMQFTLTQAGIRAHSSSQPRWDISKMTKVAMSVQPFGATNVKNGPCLSLCFGRGGDGLNYYPRQATDKIPDKAYLENQMLAARHVKAYFVMDFGAGGQHAVCFWLAEDRDYRTWWGTVSQALLPGAVALDIATSPLQAVVMLIALSELGSTHGR